MRLRITTECSKCHHVHDRVVRAPYRPLFIDNVCHGCLGLALLVSVDVEPETMPTNVTLSLSDHSAIISTDPTRTVPPGLAALTPIEALQSQVNDLLERVKTLEAH